MPSAPVRSVHLPVADHWMLSGLCQAHLLRRAKHRSRCLEKQDRSDSAGLASSGSNRGQYVANSAPHSSAAECSLSRTCAQSERCMLSAPHMLSVSSYQQSSPVHSTAGQLAWEPSEARSGTLRFAASWQSRLSSCCPSHERPACKAA